MLSVGVGARGVGGDNGGCLAGRVVVVAVEGLLMVVDGADIGNGWEIEVIFETGGVEAESSHEFGRDGLTVDGGTVGGAAIWWLIDEAGRIGEEDMVTAAVVSSGRSSGKSRCVPTGEAS